MVPFLDFRAGWLRVRAALRVKRYFWAIGAAAALLLAGFIYLLVETWVGEWASNTAWPFIRRGVVGMAEAPIKGYGLAFIGVVFGLLLLAFLETSPGWRALRIWYQERRQKPRGETPEPPVLTEQERKLVHDLRELWSLYGERAASVLHSLSVRVLERMAKQHHWAGAYRQDHEQLSNAQTTLHNTLRDDVTPLVDIRKLFQAVLTAYLRVSRNLAAIDERDYPLNGSEETEIYARWVERNAVFLEKFHGLMSHPLHSGTLGMGTAHLDDTSRVYAFLHRDPSKIERVFSIFNKIGGAKLKPGGATVDHGQSDVDDAPTETEE